MPFSRRFAGLVLLGVIPVALAALIHGALNAFIVYNIILFLLLIQDYIITPKPKELEITRVCEEKFSLGAENEVRISVRNTSSRLLKLDIKDEIPSYFREVKPALRLQAVPYESSVTSYFVMPEKRGEYTFGNVHVKYNGVLGLCSKSGKFDLTKNYKVYPNIKDLRKYTLSALKKSQLLMGVKKVKSFGIGNEFESLREYSEGDDYRKINWSATARADKLIVNTYEPEKNQQVFILLDASRVMNSEINYIKKLDYSINSAFLLADFALKKGDNVGLLVFDNTVKRFVKPRKGMAQFQLIAENLYNVEENFVTADYNNALVYLNQNHKRRSLLCIFTELFNAEEALHLASALKSVARQHIPLIITVTDPRIEEKVNGSIREFEDVFTKAASIKLLEEREKIRNIFSQARIACLEVAPDKLSIEVLNRYLQMKAMLQI
ncbi:MAG: DUF58 domain-containing protein [Clostridia bacterium]|nr:DUF58 domain-containing protein [Clostridia bacterium]